MADRPTNDYLPCGCLSLTTARSGHRAECGLRGAGVTSWRDVLDAYDEALISWRELNHDARPRYEALRAQIESALSSAPPPPQ